MNYIKRFSVFTKATMFLVLFLNISCNSNNTKEATSKAEEEQEQEHASLELTEAQMKAVDIRTDTITWMNMHAVVRASGQLAVPPQNKADVNVLIGGIVQKIKVQEGEVVHKGQVLALLENPDFIKLQEDYLKAKRSFVFTVEERQRQQELSNAKAGTVKSLQQADANFEMERARILSLKKQLQQLGIHPQALEGGNIVSQVAVQAPINGTVGHIYVNTGTYATNDKPLMEIVDNSKVHADLIVFEKDLFKVKTGQRVRFVLTNQNNRELTGKIYGINKSFENETKGIIVHAAIKNSSEWHLIPGMYVTGLISVSNEVVSAVPTAAVVHSDEKDYIFVVDNNHNHGGKTAFRKTEVAVGVQELGYSQITPIEALPNGIQVVTKGAFYLLSSEKPAGGHSH